ncbi:uncharacterized protein MYCFIDRAFT_80861 [Pseudocercospora fijiensis CIRAD86]|uniref:Uncharacterized protein n=1 Tax=Pseudocercospora fijiensis (strain CIRAD86) TaxID=383855 RepID=M3A216_PSEFD|nr:uncharacterized protein MYCFIDRAFT_80861 [Pseudocercospora fijiensis CIRAD86]EME78446.1 hypothetical protein MYCFIDRAFT_80861 [Pseudocercospora fijiensis CIRAD86]
MSREKQAAAASQDQGRPQTSRKAGCLSRAARIVELRSLLLDRLRDTQRRHDDLRSGRVRCQICAHAEEVLATFPFESMTDGANDRSSLSTGVQFARSPAPTVLTSLSGELNRQIQDVQRGFFNSTADNSTTSNTVAAATSTSSPARQKLSRRQTAVAGPPPTQTPSRSTKRTKTLTTYGSGRTLRTPKADDNSAFNALLDDQPDQQESQSLRLSHHSGGPASSRALPSGTIEDDFAKHNPNVMFRDTGSTVAFNESSEQRMLEQALQDVRQPVSSAAKLAESEKNPSSPFSLWAHTTQSPHSSQLKKSVRHDADANQDEKEQADKVVEPVEPPQSGLAAPASKPAEDLVQLETPIPDDLKTSDASQLKVSLLPRSSPQVILHTNNMPEETLSATTVQKSARGRKRKASTTTKEPSSEPLNSEDLLVGLPKERYQAKPSRRRMTELPEEPIDYSVVPEKAAKKRRKTLNDASATPETVDEAITQNAKASQKQSKSQTSKREQAVSSEAPQTTNKSAAGTPEMPAASNVSSQKSPSLSQQQADRRSALQGTGKRKAPPNKARRRIMQDDENDEDELSKEVEKEVLVPRGRPPKVDLQKTSAAHHGSNQDLDDEGEDDEAPRKRGRKAKSTRKVFDDSDAEDEIVGTEPVKKGRKSISAEMVQDDSAAEDAVQSTVEDEARPSKKKRGRSAKSKADDALPPAAEPDEATTTKDAASSSCKGAEGECNVLKAKDTITLPKVKEVSPVADSGNSKKDHAPQQARSASKSGPTTHSPIKKTSKMLNHRVGLNKKSRIPPLLKMVRPQQRKEVERVTKVTSVAELERMAAVWLSQARKRSLLALGHASRRS